MSLDATFLLGLLQIIGIDIILSGDNAVIIALACRSLPERQRRMGILFGAGAAVGLRIVFAVFITFLMGVPYLKIVGGVLLLWIGYKLMIPEDENKGDGVASGGTLWAAIRIIVIADAVMSLDNVIAIAAAAKGSVTLLVIGLLISMPLVIFGATLMIHLIARFPIIVPLGAALIGWIGGETIVTDPVIHDWIIAQGKWLEYAAAAAGAFGVIVVGKYLASRAARRAKPVVDLAAEDRR
ncbi:MAG: TerC family protein [Rhodospirillales bacterium]|nr:TerC family protein [Rhodospirillales bacterium]